MMRTTVTGVLGVSTTLIPNNSPVELLFTISVVTPAVADAERSGVRVIMLATTVIEPSVIVRLISLAFTPAAAARLVLYVS